MSICVSKIRGGREWKRGDRASSKLWKKTFPSWTHCFKDDASRRRVYGFFLSLFFCSSFAPRLCDIRLGWTDGDYVTIAELKQMSKSMTCIG